MAGSYQQNTVCVIGAGIVGLAVARELLMRYPGLGVTVVDKELAVGQHQTGHNSGVIHAGIYYRPGSLKAELCASGRSMLRQFCSDHAIAVEQCGKLVVAKDEAELAGLERIHESALSNGVPGLTVLDAAGLREIEPAARGVRALHSPTTAIVNFGDVATALVGEISSLGGTITLGRRVARVVQAHGTVRIGDADEMTEFDRVIMCGGLHSDELAVLAGDDPDPQIIPFRGEYYRLSRARAALVNGLIYPVPDPRYPFLGIHFTRRIDGNVDIGPNAVLALAKEGYRRRDVDPHDALALFAWRGFWAMARKNWRAGVKEITTSVSRRAFVRAARAYLPALEIGDIVASPSGVRAQAVDRRGGLVDDFCIRKLGAVVAVRNAPSPAATSSLAIAQHICEWIELS